LTFILTYHDVVSEDRQDSVGFDGTAAGRYKLTPDAFAEHLDSIAASGAQVGLLRAGEQPPAVALTFDDGGTSAKDIAQELERHGWRGHFFATTSRIGSPGFLEEEELVQLARRGHVIGSHSHTHPTYMGRLDQKSIDREWVESRALLADVLGEPPDIASVPGGFVTPTVLDSASRAGYRILLTSEPRSRPRLAGSTLVLGRYSIWATTPAATAAKYARGDVLACWRLLLGWEVKTAAKQLSPTLYEKARHRRPGRR
jgi:peptidoglycan/xylan/chitin deacetylase (PgdA/CDA1 family)